MRAEILYDIGQMMKERKEHLSQILTQENGKVLEEARGEVQEGIDMAFYMAGEGRRLFGHTVPAELKNKFAMSVRAPVGVVESLRHGISLLPLRHGNLSRQLWQEIQSSGSQQQKRH